jgi:hypothetical protein
MPPPSRGLPYEVRKAFIQVCGKSFWLKDILRDFMVSAGVPDRLFDRYVHEAKFQIGRHVLGELDHMGDEGWSAQRRMLTLLCQLTDLPDDTVPDPVEARRALVSLRELCRKHDLAQQEQRQDAAERQQAVQAKAKAAEERVTKMAALYQRFLQLAASDDAQARGYALEPLLADLFELEEIVYRRSFKTERDQVDGAFVLGFDYLVEARWRGDFPTLDELEAFRAKVDRRIESTRGLFVSMKGFKSEIVREFGGRRSNVILMDGGDLALILEGQVSLRQALELKTQKAAQEGIVFFELRRALVS